MKLHNLIKPAALAALALILTSMPARAETVVLTDGFGGSDNDSLDGRVPDGVNLPGRTWQQNGGYFGRCDIQGNTMNVRSMDGEAYDLSSNETFTKPAVLTVQVDLMPGTLNRMGIGMGFTGEPNTYNATVYYVGLSVDQNGTVKEWEGVPADPQDAIGEVAWSGIDNAPFSPDDWHTLTYTINTATGKVSNVSLSGSNADYSSLHAIVNPGLTYANTRYVTAMGDAQSGNGNGNIDNFQLSAPLSITLAAAPNVFVEDAGVAASTGTVSIPEVLEADLVIALSSSDTTEATVPESVTIVAGMLAATFPIDAVNDSEADGAQVVTLTATATGYVAGGMVLTVNDDADTNNLAPPPVELGSQSVASGNSRVSLSWSASSGATSYNVKRSTVSGSGYETIGTMSGTDYSDNTAVNGTTYYYVITAVNSAGESAASAELSATPMTVGDTLAFGPGSLILADGFGGNNGDNLDGSTPDDTNLPGRSWQQNGGYFGRSDIQGNTMNVRSMDGEAYDISSNETYSKPTVMIIRADLKPGTLNRMGVGAGFTDSTNTGNSTYSFSGLSLDENGTVKEWNGVPADPQNTIREVAWAGIGGAAFSPNDWHTLTYTVNTATCRISNVSLSGSTADYSPLCSIHNGGLTDERTTYVTVMGDAQSGDGNGNIDNFLLFAPTITPSADPYADWIAGFDFTAFTNPDLTATGNPSGDGLSNQLKFAYGLDPSHAEDFSNGLTRETWVYLAGTRVADLTGTRSRFLREPDERCKVPDVNDVSRCQNYASRYRGFLTAPVTGTYQFWIAGDDEAELWLADGTLQKSINGQTVALTNRYGKLRIASIQDPHLGQNRTQFQDFDAFPSQRSRQVQLTAGQKYYFEVLHKQGGESDHVAVAWQVPGFTREIIPATAFNADFTQADDLDSDNLPDSWEIQVSLNPADNGITNPRDGQYGDWDGDSLTNLEEYQLGTDPTLADTDGDGVSDGDEVKMLGTQALTADVAPFESIATLSGDAYTASSGGWSKEYGKAAQTTTRGWIEFPLTLSAAGVYQLDLTFTPAADIDVCRDYEIVFSADGKTIQRAIASVTDRACGHAKIFSPWLAAGNHTLRVFIDNSYHFRRVNVDQLEVLAARGMDGNANGVPDWVEARLAQTNSIEAPSTSLTSPVCLEGKARWSTLSSVANAPVQAAPNDRWFANVALDATQPTDVSASMENGGIQSTSQITWLTTNLFAAPTLTIRQGDALKLSAFTGTVGTSGETVTLTVYDQSVTITADQAIVQTFPTAGNIPVQITHTQDGTVTTATVTVRVVAAPVVESPVCVVGFQREVIIPALPAGITHQFDESIQIFHTTATVDGGMLHSLRLNTLNDRPSVFRLSGDAGPILGTLPFRAMRVRKGAETAVFIAAELGDDTWDVEMPVIIDGLYEGVTLRFDLFIAGSTFDDGSTIKTLAVPEDFTAQGECSLHVCKIGSGGSICHHSSAFQGTVEIANYQ